jgi:hypothetical protein
MPFNGASAAAQAANEAGSGPRRRMLRNSGQGLIQIQVCPPSPFMRGRGNRANLKPKLDRDRSFRTGLSPSRSTPGPTQRRWRGEPRACLSLGPRLYAAPFHRRILCGS